jgi:hypothetical protein
MAGAFLTMLLMLFSLIGGMVAGAIIRTRRLKGFGLAVAALASIYIAGSASSIEIRIVLFVMIALTILDCYIDSVVRARESQNPPTKGV